MYERQVKHLHDEVDSLRLHRKDKGYDLEMQNMYS